MNVTRTRRRWLDGCREWSSLGEGWGKLNVKQRVRTFSGGGQCLVSSWGGGKGEAEEKIGTRTVGRGVGSGEMGGGVSLAVGMGGRIWPYTSWARIEGFSSVGGSDWWSKSAPGGSGWGTVGLRGGYFIFLGWGGKRMQTVCEKRLVGVESTTDWGVGPGIGE